MNQLLEIRIKPQGKILSEYFYSDCRCDFIMGPLGSGKTIQTCQKAFTRIINQAPNKDGIRPTRVYVVRNTYSDLLRTIVRDWLSLYGELGNYVQGNKEPPTHYMDFNLEDGTKVSSEIVFIALDRPDSIKSLRGAQVTFFILSEIKELAKAVIDMADLRHGRYPSRASGGVMPTWHGMIGDTNAPDDDHWYYKQAEEEKPEGWKFHRQPGGLIKVGEEYIENPEAENIGNLPPNYYKNGCAGKAKDWIDVNLCNEYGYVKTGKPIYPQYVDSVHCLPDNYVPNIAWPIIIGCDFGRTPAAALIQYNPNFGRYVGFDEFVTEDMSAATFAPELKKYLDKTYPDFSFARGGGDPSGDSGGQATDDTPFTILHKHSLPVYPVHTNNPLIRRSVIINNLGKLCMDGKPAFMISPKCKMWRKGLAGGFSYRRLQVVGDERYTDEPDKNIYSHICEAGEYGLMSAGEGRKAVKREDSKFSSPVQVNNSWSVI